MRTGVTSLSHQVHVPLLQRSVSHGHSECHLDHMPTVHGCPFIRGPCHLPPWERGDCVDDVMWCPRLKPRKLYPTGSWVEWQVTALVLPSEAESTYSFSDLRSQI